MAQAFDWTALLIGGTSAAGKTTLAESLAARFQARYIDLDLFWIVLHRTVSPQVAPELHLLDDDAVWDEEPHWLVEQYLRVSAYVCGAIEPLVAHHHKIGRRVVMEGCWVLPKFALQRTFAGTDTGDSVRSMFLCEPDVALLEARIRARPQRWLETLPMSSQRRHLEMQRLFGEVIAAQARSAGLPTLASQPFETLIDRVLEALEQSARP